MRPYAFSREAGRLSSGWGGVDRRLYTSVYGLEEHVGSFRELPVGISGASAQRDDCTPCAR